MAPLLLIDTPAPHIRQLTLNRPEQLNTMNAELCEELHVALRAIAAERDCRAVILTGGGRGFCAGVDLHGYGAAPGNDGSDEPREFCDGHVFTGSDIDQRAGVVLLQQVHTSICQVVYV